MVRPYCFRRFRKFVVTNSATLADVVTGFGTLPSWLSPNFALFSRVSMRVSTWILTSARPDRFVTPAPFLLLGFQTSGMPSSLLWATADPASPTANSTATTTATLRDTLPVIPVPLVHTRTARDSFEAPGPRPVRAAGASGTSCPAPPYPTIAHRAATDERAIPTGARLRCGSSGGARPAPPPSSGGGRGSGIRRVRRPAGSRAMPRWSTSESSGVGVRRAPS